MTYAAQHHYARKMALQAHAEQLLAQAEKSLSWLIGERDCIYEGASTPCGDVPDEGDRQALACYDRDIEQLQALIAAAKGEPA
ncbi:MAG: hypothetical protein KDJ24_03925 [Gammaproteobacteria bacterium]|nr:hypothetical protein [Gammaproteobacteria bacterium]